MVKLTGKKKARVEVEQVAPAPVEVAPALPAPVAEQSATTEPKARFKRYAPKVWSGDWVVTVLTTQNPKRNKSGAQYGCRDRYAVHVTGETVDQYYAKIVELGKKLGTGWTKGIAEGDLSWEVQRNFISITPPAKA